MNKRLLLASLLICASHLPAQIEDTGPETKAKCNEYMKTPLPAEASAVAAPNSWPGCDSYKSYLGIGRNVDFAAARQCAWSERLAIQAGIEPRFSTASVFGGSAMLAVLYANGRGASRNIPLALRFACEAGGAPAEIEGRLAHLESAHASQNLSDARFNFCDDITSGFMEGFCAGLQSEIAAQKRQDALDSLSSQWPHADKDAFAALEKQAESFANAHGGYETYRGGTIRTLRMNGVEERQRDNFLAAVRSFEAGRLPAGTETDYRRADSDLNETYRKALALAAQQNFAEDNGDIHPEDIQKAEREWIRYRDAWIVFAKVHYPETSQYAWLTLLTRNRYWSLRQTMCDVGWNHPACGRSNTNP